jgi:hypothetical protein
LIGLWRDLGVGQSPDFCWAGWLSTLFGQLLARCFLWFLAKFRLWFLLSVLAGVGSEKESCLRHYLWVMGSLFIGLFSGINVMDQYYFFVP